MIRAIGLDDELPALAVLTHYCRQIEDLDLEKTYTRPSAALQHIVENKPDLLFLDINMPNITGIDLYKSISFENKIPVIFTTALTEYAVEGFNLDAVDYLLKPYTFERFQQAIEKAKKSILSHDTSPQYFWVRADYILHKITFSDILYIEGLDDYTKIHLDNTKTIVARLTLKKLMDKLPKNDFLRVHKSFIVAIKHIESVRNKTLILRSTEIPVGKTYVSYLAKTLK